MSRERDFWSRRREAVRAEADAEEAARLTGIQAKDQAELEESSDEEILAKLELPNPDAMKPGDDFSKFMASAVPDRLRRRALRKLWLSNPLLANVDGLVDYGEDFTDSALAVENLQTAYQVGKGMLKHVMEMERQREAEDAEAIDVANVPDRASEPEPLASATEGNETTVQDLEPVAEQNESDALVSELEDEIVPAPRRMQFTFETDVA
ncbi:MAG: DUF3306 domain-containing protein [Boseongicola sp.]